MNIHDILLAQRRENEAGRSALYVGRSSVVEPVAGGRIRVVVGPRRAGKSSYALHRTCAEPGAWGYANFDDERLGSLEDYDELVVALDALYGCPQGFFFDEIQNLPKWELFVNRLHRAGRNLLLTGSNAHLLSSELATHLTGRHVPIPLLPFSFPEFVSAEGAGPKTDLEMRAACRKYARMGGFPEVVLKGLSGSEYLRTLVASVIYKDIVSRFRPRAPGSIETIARCLLSQPGGEYSFQALTRATGCRSPHTLKKHIGWLEEAFVVFTVPRFSFKPREQAASNKKAYAVDTGFVDALGAGLSPNWGRLFENLVAIQLFRRQLRGESRFFFWKDPHGIEADFVVQEGLAIRQIVQVSLATADPKTRQREIRGLCKASRDLGCGDLLLLTEKEEGRMEETWEGSVYPIRTMPVWKWLLAAEQG
ncbi:MAG: ATP-binding protein [Verrucomicrobia bacterium]|nr:ATP-binding protein [Verrucomicrobiota bacterium]